MTNKDEYNKKYEEEIQHYKKVENVHELPEIFHYFSNKFLLPKLQSFGFTNLNDFYTDYINALNQKNPGSTISIASIGAGNCDMEVGLAEVLIKNGINDFSFHCVDLNSHMLERGRCLSEKQGLGSKFNFLQSDINKWKPDKTYHIIIASHSLHHIVELELLFDRIYDSLLDGGYFLVHDMIGRNGHMRWPEALELVQALWSLLDKKYKYNWQLKRYEEVFDNWDCSKEGFEGIRSQDILPLLVKRFQFEMFLGFNNIIDVFVDRSFGHNFNKDYLKDRCFIDFVAGLDDYFIESGRLKPTQIIAALQKNGVEKVRTYKHLTPEFCVRVPDKKVKEVP